MIGIVGYGFVGRAVGLMETVGSVSIYDKYLEGYQSNLERVINEDFVFVCVPTNQTLSGALDTSIVEAVSRWWAFRRDNKDSILIIKSTVPVGTTDHLQEILGTDRIVFNPEFLTQRTANVDFLTADEVIIGASNQSVSNAVLDLYCQFLEGGVEYSQVTPKTAELIKLARNSLYAVKIEFMNEVYDLCQELEVDYDIFRNEFVFEGKNAWVGDQHTYVPGPDGQRGYGGKCLPKDSKGLLTTFREHGLDALVLEAAVRGNKPRRKE